MAGGQLAHIPYRELRPHRYTQFGVSMPEILAVLGMKMSALLAFTNFWRVLSGSVIRCIPVKNFWTVGLFQNLHRTA
jgi:hypothetical protein